MRKSIGKSTKIADAAITNKQSTYPDYEQDH